MYEIYPGIYIIQEPVSWIMIVIIEFFNNKITINITITNKAQAKKFDKSVN